MCILKTTFSTKFANNLPLLSFQQFNRIFGSLHTALQREDSRKRASCNNHGNDLQAREF